MAERSRQWIAPVALGVWLGIASGWLVATVPIGRTQILWQPLLLLSLAYWAFRAHRHVGWRVAVGRSVWMYVIVNLASWLPSLRTTISPNEIPYAPFYGRVLPFYEAGLAALIGFQAVKTVFTHGSSWWNQDGWSRPLVVAPFLLLARGIFVHNWMASAIGMVIGGLLAALRPWRWWCRCSPAMGWRLVSYGLLLVAALLVFVSGLRIYHETGVRYPLASDDGPSFYQDALEIATDPSRCWSPPPIETNFFSAYPILMGWWFWMVGGAYMPSWLLWHALAAGLLALVVYRLGCFCGSRMIGLVAAGLVVADHVMLHLMATLNMEVFFIPMLYVALWLWASIHETQPLEQCRMRGVLAGLALSVATLFRPTSGLLPFVWLILLACERPRRSWAQVRAQGAWMMAGFLVPTILLLIRHRFVWGHWTLGANRGALLSWQVNYAWEIQGQHPAVIGLGPWWRLVASEPSVIWHKMIPDWWAQIVYLWTHRGFGQMDLIQGLNYSGPYQAALASILTVSVLVGIGLALQRRTRADLLLLSLPLYFSSLALVYYVINTRYRAPFIPMLYLLSSIGFATAAAVRPRTITKPSASP